MTNSTFRVHGPRGMIERVAEAFAERAREHRHRSRTGADQVPVTEIMIQEQLGCVPVVNEGVMMPLAIASDRRLVGVVSTMDVTRGLAQNDELPR